MDIEYKNSMNAPTWLTPLPVGGYRRGSRLGWVCGGVCVLLELPSRRYRSRLLYRGEGGKTENKEVQRRKKERGSVIRVMDICT